MIQGEHPMKPILIAGLMIAMVVSLGVTARAEDRNAEVQQAMKAADAWLRLIDEGKYRESWEQSAGFFRDKITADGWAKMVGPVREPLGKVTSRKFKAAQYATRLPGAPAGQYVVIQYDTDYANKAGAVETVTPMLDKDGKWRVSGYYIR
jgi:hypothetical protein